MKKLKLFFACLLMAVLSIGQVWATTTYTKVTSVSSLSDGDKVVIAQGSTAPTVGVKGGTVQSSTTTKKDAVVSSTESEWLQFTVTTTTGGWYLSDGTNWIGNPAANTFYLTTSTSCKGVCSVDENGVLVSNSRYLVQNSTYYRMYTSVGSNTPFYVWKVTTSGGSEPALSVSPAVIDFGTVDQNASVEPQEVTVTFENLTGTVSYSGLSGAFVASGTIDNSGDKITITPNTATIGNYSQTLTVQSAADSKSQDVTVKMNVVEPFDGLKLTFDFVTHPEGWPAAKASAVAGNYVYTISATDYTFAHSKVGDGIYCGGTSGSSGYLMIAKSNSLGLPAISGYKLVKVEGTLNNSGTPSTKAEITITNGTDEVTGGASQTWDEKGVAKTYNLSGTVANTMYYLNVSGTANLQMITLVLYYEEAEAPTVAAPTISGVTPFLSSTEVTLTQDAADAIYYTTDEAKKGTPDVDTWTVYNSASKPSFSETTTIYAAAIKGSAWSAVAEKTFTKATILTPSEALAIINSWSGNKTSEEYYYVAGTVSTVSSITVGGTGEYYISNDGATTEQLQVYKGKWVNGANFTSADQLQEGDDVTIKGKLKKYNSYKELDQNNEVVLYKLKARLAWSEESYEADLSSSNTYPSLTNTNGVTVAYSSSNTDAATIDPATGEITLVAIGSTNITATFTGNETYKANEVSYTLNVSNSVIRADISFEENGGSDVADLTDQSNLPDPLPTITKAGYNFGGWWTTSDFQAGTEAVAGAAVESTDDIVLYAKWLDPYTVTEALTMIDALADNGETGNVYVSGIVCTAPSNLISGGYLTYYISVDGTETNRLQVYKGKDENNVAFTDKDNVQKDDQVVVFGPLKKFKQGENIIPEFNTGNYLYSLSRKQDANLEWSAIAFDAFIGQSNTFPTLSKPDGVTIVYSSSNSTAATIDEYTGAITLGTTPNVSTTITATLSGDATYKDDVATYTLNVYNPTNPGTITYEENGGSTVADVTTPVDNFPDPLPTPTKENNIFAGWWTTSTFNDGTQAVAGAPMDGNVILYAKWTEIPVLAYTYTSNVTLTGAKVKFYGEETEYDAVKAGTGKVAGSVDITIPAQATKLHFHAYGWNDETVGLTVTAPAGVTVSPATEISINSNDGIASNSPFILAEGSTPMTDAYYVVELSGNTEETTLTFTATSGKRFVLFGVNQEGGVLPVLDHIEISGDLSTKTGYKVGDALDLDGLTVEATYSLGGVAQSPVDITSDPELELTYDPLVENQTEVTITASYKGQTDDITITGLDPVASADPKIYVSTLNVNFASVEVGDAVPAAQTITVNLTNIASVTATLGGTNPEAFSISKTEGVVDGDEITISLLANTDAVASYSATITISDGEEGAVDKTVNLSFEVTEPVVEDDVTGTWTLVTNATTLAAGKKVIIAQYVEADGAINTMAGQASNNRSVIASTVAGATLTPTVGTKVMTLADAGEGHFYLKTSDGEYLYNASGTKSYLRTKATSDDASWTIAVTAEGVATITAVENTTRPIMRYNPNTSGSPLFNCYASGQEDIALYMLEEDEPTPDYTREVTIGNYGTICLPKAGTIEGASIFEIAYYGEASKTIFVDEITSGHMSAGVPYIFQATAAQLKVTYDDKNDVDVAASYANGLYGFYNLSNMATDEADKLDLDKDQGNYILYNNQYWLVSGRDAFIYNFRAYIKLSEINPKEPALAPGRRRVAMAVNGENAATGFENLDASEKPLKVMIDGTMYILRGEKVYDATGRLVK